MTSTNAPALSPGSSAPTGTRALVFSLFLFSGVSGLIYEVVWSRMLTHVLGTTVYAVATVLAVFMGGLALGSWLFGRVVDRPGVNGLRLYAWLEFGIGVCALALPMLMLVSDRLFQFAWPAVWQSFPRLMTLRVLLAVLMLIVPATLMGGTLPVLSRFLVKSKARAGLDIGTLYAINTLGAVLGCFLAGFFLLELLGARGSLFTAAGLNFAVGFTALFWARRAPVEALPESTTAPPRHKSPYLRWQIQLAFVLYAVSGFAALVLEVLWTRGLMYFTSVDLWAFTAMLTAFLCGLGLGSLIMARFVARIRNPLRVLGLIQLLAGLTAAASIPLFGSLFSALEWAESLIQTQGNLAGKITTKLFASFFIMLLPTLLMGAAFPLIAAVYVGAKEKIGRGIGALYALNTVGAIGGSLIGGFFLIPLFGLENSILLAASLFVAIGLALLLASPIGHRPRVRGMVVASALLALLVWANVSFRGSPLVLKSAFFKNEMNQHTLIFANEGSGASLVVLENPNGTRLLNINGISTAFNNYMDMQVHRMLSHLPMLIHPDPRNVLVVGFGMGSTPWGCCQHDVDRVDVVELLPSERDTAQFFQDVNHNVLDHPKLNFIVGDGRNYLLGTRERYDVISFNAIHPRFSASLYTKDFYELCRKRMSDDGVICAWMTQNSMTQDEFRALIRAFVEVFPNSTLWFNNPEHYCLVGTIAPTRIDLEDWRTRMSRPGVHADLADSNLDDPYVLLSRYMLGPAELAEYIRDAPLNTDDHPIVEFSRESKLEERLVAQNLLDLIRPPGAVIDLGPDEDSTATLDAYLRGSRWMMAGEIDFWYPDGAPGLKPEIAYRRALLECPDNQDVREHLLFSRGFEAKVIAARNARPEDPGPWTHLGRMFREQGRVDEARAALQEAYARRPGFPLIIEQAGLLELLAGRPDVAVPLLAQAQQAMRDPRTLYALGIAHERLAHEQQAEQLKQQALAIEPDMAEWFDLLQQNFDLMRDRRQN